MILYLIVGLVWSMFLEYYTTKYFEGPIGESFNWRERTFHIAAWPLSFGYFIYTWIIYKDND